MRTERLLLETWSEAHTRLLIRLSAIADVTRFIGNGETWTPARAQVVAADKRAHRSRHGLGWRAAFELATGEPVGVMAANVVGEGTAGLDPADHEIGWWLDPVAWGRGLRARGRGRAVPGALRRRRRAQRRRADPARKRGLDRRRAGQRPAPGGDDHRRLRRGRGDLPPDGGRLAPYGPSFLTG